MIRFFGKHRIYLDHASAPPVRKEALSAMRATERLVGNPGAIHRDGVEAKHALENARERIAKLLGVKARELIFTSGLTEANNIAIVGFARALERTRRSLEGTDWLVSSVEHASVLECFAEIERLGGTVRHVEPGERGIITAEKLKGMLKSETVFVSIGWANNEIGTVQPLRDIAHAVRAFERVHGTHIALHTDAGQAPLYEASLVHSLGVDLLSLGSNKLYGPHGIGALYLSNDVSLAPIILGGRQERGLRAGTENVALAQGFAAAYEASVADRDAEAARLKALRDRFAAQLLERIPGLLINGDLKRVLPHMLNISIPAISSEYMTLALDHAGIAVSTKSACREGEESFSHAVVPLGGPDWRAKNTLRLSLGRETTLHDCERVVHALQRLLRVPTV